MSEGMPRTVQLIFARNEITRDEVFAGIAADRATEILIAGHIDADPIVCWSQPEVVRSSVDGPTDGDRVYVVFENGGPQDSPVMGWDFTFQPEPHGVFSDRAGAEASAADLARHVPSAHVWELEIGWFDYRLVTERSA